MSVGGFVLRNMSRLELSEGCEVWGERLPMDVEVRHILDQVDPNSHGRNPKWA